MSGSLIAAIAVFVLVGLIAWSTLRTKGSGRGRGSGGTSSGEGGREDRER